MSFDEKKYMFLLYRIMNKSYFTDKKKIIKEMNEKQLKNVAIERKLHFKDMTRISKYIESSIFNEKECCLWNGYITNESNFKRGTYINFFFRNKKVALHRLLYENYVEPLSDDYYIKFTCDENNCGKCCNINHMIKYKYNNVLKINNKVQENINDTIIQKDNQNKTKNKKKQLTECDMRIIFE
ncbi:hypothetical protein BMW23_0694 [Bodo saltans virus]|uniref:Uncharacterized protein n=1 Tax=Bodo saltans virus TaxID=2024608 RepID=A0A2H4UUZ3_9VIRU|nr:hypothetical protein QJ851_gp0677 [Bodo saltans virus]ATZ80740.1 hypothetical protein BMW23_0694 [Bodo saltans virus]